MTDVVTASIDGYAIGGGVNNIWLAPNGWGGLGSPEVRPVREPAPRRHGGYDMTTLYGPRIMPVRGWCGDAENPGGAAAAIEAFDQLKARLWAEDEHLVVLRRRGRSADEQFTARLGSEITDDAEAGNEVINWSLSLVASDPLLYGTTLNTLAGTTNGGITIPSVGGTVPTPAILQVRGPTNAAGTLTIGNGLGPSIALTMAATTLPAYDPGNSNSFFDVYLGDRVVDYLGTARPSWVDAAATTWWQVPDGGPVTLTMGGTYRAAGTRLAVYWREARI